jgi:hypothetical protein
MPIAPIRDPRQISDPYGHLGAWSGAPDWLTSIARYIAPQPLTPIGGALFKNPGYANLFRTTTQFHPYTAGGVTRPIGAGGSISDAALIRLNQEFMKEWSRKLFGGEFGSEAAGTLARNAQSSRMGQTFAKNILPWSGAAHQNPMVFGDEARLLHTLLSGIIP